MKVGLDVSQMGNNKAGCGYVAYGLVHYLTKQDELDITAYPTWGPYVWDPDWETAVAGALPEGVKTGFHHETHSDAISFWRTAKGDLSETFGKMDILHSNNFFCPDVHVANRLVYTLYDLSFLKYPDWSTEANRLVCFEGVRRASLNADIILSISEFSRQHFLETFPYYPAERIITFPLGSRFDPGTLIEKPHRFDLLREKNFWLILGTIEPRKNHLRLLEAYARLKVDGHTQKPLVIAGQMGWRVDGFHNKIEEMGLQDDVIITGYVSEGEADWLLNNAFSLCYPSLWEGFGLPPLEAMNVGTPVIASNTSSMPEVVGNSGILVNPYNVEHIFEGMLRLENEDGLAQKLAASGRMRAQHYTWDAAGSAVFDAYKLALELPPLHENDQVLTGLI